MPEQPRAFGLQVLSLPEWKEGLSLAAKRGSEAARPFVVLSPLVYSFISVDSGNRHRLLSGLHIHLLHRSVRPESKSVDYNSA